MRLLVIGGTQFFGRALVEAALERGDAVTVLSRGERRPPFWDRIMHVAADRRDQAAFTAALRGREVDAVVDNNRFHGTACTRRGSKRRSAGTCQPACRRQPAMIVAPTRLPWPGDDPDQVIRAPLGASFSTVSSAT